MARFRRCYLHIGFEKTGSTSIQSFLTDNIERLRQHGYFVPTSMARADGFCNHMRICAYALDAGKTSDDTLIHYGITGPDDVSAFREETIARLTEEADNASDRRFLILSNEHLSSRINSLEELERLKELLYRFCDNVRVIAYLRRQTDVLQSAYNEAVKAGFHDIALVPDFQERPWELRPKERPWVERSYFEYYAKLEQWAEVFGDRNILVKLFDRKTMLFGDVVQDFLFSIHLDPSKFGNFPRLNEGLARSAQLFMQNINKPLSALPTDQAARVRDLLSDILMAKARGNGRRLSAAEISAFQSQFAADNERIRLKWFPGRAALFAAPDQASLPNQDSASDRIELDEAFEIMCLVLQEIII